MSPEHPSGPPAPIISARGIGKHFAGEQALAGVDFDLRPGEIHALLGGNGAGKSTLIKIMAGVISADEGELEVDGASLGTHFSPADVKAAGLAFVHQDLGLLDHLTVSENIALAVGYATRGRVISFRRSSSRAAGYLSDLGVSISPDALVRDLSQDQKVMVAVARAFALDARAIVLDEVSSSLPAPEVERLASALRTARDAGIGYVYVTHRIGELPGLVDRVTILRDGRRVATRSAAGLDHATIVDLILGEEAAAEIDVPDLQVRSAPRSGRPLRLRVKGLQAPALAEPISFDAEAGEVIGVCGLVGSGARQVAGVLGGQLAPGAGSAELDGEELPLGSPAALRGLGVSYVPGDRQAEGAVTGMSIRENLFIDSSEVRTSADLDGGTSRPRRSRPRMIHPGRERARARTLIDRFEVRPPGRPDRPIATLSGGNQQKVIFARALRSAPRLLVVDDPTAGVDIGSRAQLHAIVRQAAAGGTTVLFASTDFEEVAGEADRVLVMANGRLAAVLESGEVNPDRLARASYGDDEEQPMEARDVG